ncbi:MAG: YtxH domain-containing protein [Blastocatellia bacterium]|nr:YtxH domain-containing protein [Blastocatellia bacterium]
MAEDSGSTKLTYFLIGAGIGAVVALLFAPKSGRELRGDIKDATRRGVEYTQDNARMLSSKASELYATGREKATNLYESGRGRTNDLLETGREALTDQRARVAAAIEAGKRAYQDKKAEAQGADSDLAPEGSEA